MFDLYEYTNKLNSKQTLKKKNCLKIGKECAVEQWMVVQFYKWREQMCIRDSSSI